MNYLTLKSKAITNGFPEMRSLDDFKTAPSICLLHDQANSSVMQSDIAFSVKKSHQIRTNRFGLKRNLGGGHRRTMGVVILPITKIGYEHKLNFK